MFPAIQLLLSKKYKNEKGMTLIELIIAMAFISLIVALVTTIHLSAGKTSKDVINITKSEIDSRVAIYRVSHDLREANSIILAEGDKVKFLSNVDADDDYEEVFYYLESEDGYYNLVKSVDSGEARTISTHLIANNIFSYYSGTQLSEDGLAAPVAGDDLENISLIKVNISIDQSGSQSLRTMDLGTLIALRNKI